MELFNYILNVDVEVDRESDSTIPHSNNSPTDAGET